MTQVVVLAGGKATRLYPLTKKTPKGMILINGVPFIEHQIRLFKKNKISNIILCLGTLHEQITKYIGDGTKFGVTVKYSVENPESLLGTLGALKNAYDLLDEDFFLIFGDSYLDVSYQAIYDKFLESKKMGLMTVYKNINKEIPNNVAIKNGMVIEYDKNKTNNFEYVDYGLSVFRKKVLDFFLPDQNLDLSLLIKKLISINQLVAYVVKNRFYEVGSFQGIKDLEYHLKSE